MSRVITVADEFELDFLLRNFNLPADYKVLARQALFSVVGKDGDVVAQEALDVLAQFPNALKNETERLAILAFVNNQILNGNWNLIDEFQCYAMNDPLNALQGWKGLRDATLANAPAHVGGEGFVGTGTEFISTSFLESTDGGIENDFYTGVWLTKNTSVDLLVDERLYGAGSMRIDQRTTLESMQFRGQGITLNHTGVIGKALLGINSVGNATSFVINSGGVKRTAGASTTGSLEGASTFQVMARLSASPFQGTAGAWWYGQGIGFNTDAWDSDLATLIGNLNASANDVEP